MILLTVFTTYRFEITDLLPYIIFYGLLLLCQPQHNSLKDYQRSMILMLAIVLIFASIRFGIGFDYIAYYNYIMGYTFGYAYDNMEPIALWLINYSGKTHFQIFFIVTACLIYLPIWYVCKRLSVNPVLSFLVYILFPMFFNESLSVVRNHVAYAGALLAFYFFINKRYLFSISSFLFAVGFHYSILFSLLIYVVYKSKYGRSTNLVIYIFSLFLSVIVMQLITSGSSNLYIFRKMQKYAEDAGGGGNFMTLILNLLAIFNFVYWDLIAKGNKTREFLLKSVSTGVIVWNLFGFDYTLRLRLSTFFLLFFIFLVPYYREVFKMSHIAFKRIVILVLFTLISANFYLVIMDNINNFAKISPLPYQTVFDYIIY